MNSVILITLLFLFIFNDLSFDKLNVLSDILDLDLVEDAQDNYILISKSEDSLGKINFINKFGDKTIYAYIGRFDLNKNLSDTKIKQAFLGLFGT